jgi:S1-C subfamily serine protease
MSRVVPLLSGLLGGLVAVVVGALLISTGVIDTGEQTREVVRQQPITRPAADGDEEGLTVSEIFEDAGPGVVFIRAEVPASAAGGTPFGPPQRKGQATGSGFVLDREGYILTNAHVVEGARNVQVHFDERGDDIDARVVGRDPSTDLAVLKVPSNTPKLDPIPLGDSRSARVGDPVIAIGNPFGLERTVTTGIVSAIARQIDAPNQFTIDNVIQTDASINPGNSGGPLLDAAGRVIGINAQIATGGSSGGSVGIGFAVPVSTAKEVVPQLKRSGSIDRSYLGITTAPITGRVAEELNLPVRDGALVQEVVPGGPADRAGLRAGRTRTEEGLTIGGDIIVRVAGQDVKRPEDVAAAIRDDKPGATVPIDILRRGERETVQVKLGKRPAESPRSLRPQQPRLP